MVTSICVILTSTCHVNLNMSCLPPYEPSVSPASPSASPTWHAIRTAADTCSPSHCVVPYPCTGTVPAYSTNCQSPLPNATRHQPLPLSETDRITNTPWKIYGIWRLMDVVIPGLVHCIKQRLDPGSEIITSSLCQTLESLVTPIQLQASAESGVIMWTIITWAYKTKKFFTRLGIQNSG